MTKQPPSAAELTAHVRTAVDGSKRWLDRALAAPLGAVDLDAWDQRNFYARMMLMRGLERGELLGWVLQRDVLAAGTDPSSMPLRQAASYWQEARPDLHRAISDLRRVADLEPSSLAARDGARAARAQLTQASGWLVHLADGLARLPSPVIELDRSRPPLEPSLGLDLL